MMLKIPHGSQPFSALIASTRLQEDGALVAGQRDPRWLAASRMILLLIHLPIGSMYAIYGNIYHQYTPNVSIYTIHGSYGLWM